MRARFDLEKLTVLIRSHDLCECFIGALASTGVRSDEKLIVGFWSKVFHSECLLLGVFDFIFTEHPIICD